MKTNPLASAARLTIACLIGSFSATQAATFVTTTGGATWGGGTWTSVPAGTTVNAGGPRVGNATGGDDAIIDGTTVTVTDGNGTGGASGNDFTVRGGNTVTIQNGGTLARDTSGGNWVRIGDSSSTGTVNIEDGAWEQNRANMRIGVRNGTGIFNIGDGIGAAGSATYTHDAGAGEFSLGHNNGGSGQGIVTVESDGALHVDGDWMHIGRHDFAGVQSSITVNTDGQFSFGDGVTNSGGLEIGRFEGGNGLVDINGGSGEWGVLNTAINRQVIVGHQGDGEFVIRNNGVWNQNSGQIRVGLNGSNNAYSGHLEVDGGTLNLLDEDMTPNTATPPMLVNTRDNQLIIGDQGIGSLRIADGSVNQFDSNINIGNAANGNGTVNIDLNGILNIADRAGASENELIVGNNGTGIVNINNGGILNSFDDDLRIANGTNSTGVINVNTGGLLDHNPGGGNRFFQIGFRGDGTLNIDGGTANIDTTIQLGDDPQNGGMADAKLIITDGTLNQTGGDLLLDVGQTTIMQTGGTATLNDDIFLDNGGLGDIDLLGGTFTLPGDVEDRGGFTDFLIGGTSIFTADNILFDDAADSMDDIFTVSGSSQSINVANDLTINNDDAFNFVFDAAGFNPIVVGGNVNLAGAQGTFDFSNYTTHVPFMSEIPLVNIAGAGSNGVGGIFENFGQLDIVGGAAGNTFLLSRTGGDGNDLVLIAVPEPSRALLAIAGLSFVLFQRRRR